MEKKDSVYQAYKEVLQQGLRPAFGCTEPIALAFVAAVAKQTLGREPDKIIARCSGNIIKNVKSVIVPGTEGERGIEISCILGAIAGDASRELEVLSAVRKEDIARAKQLRAEGICRVELAENVENLYIQILLFAGEDRASVSVQGMHTNIVEITKNGVLLQHKDAEESQSMAVPFSFADIYEYADTCDVEALREIFDKQIAYNMAIAKEGMAKDYGANIGKMQYREDAGIENKMVAYAAAGSDARMAGSEMPVVINSGSGNQGITVSVPLILYAEHIQASREDLYRALIFANLIGEYLKSKIGRLSAYCGVVSAASAAVAGMAYLDKEEKSIIEATLSNALAGNSGIICDGAKASCAMKISSSLNNALLAYRQAKSANSFKGGDGIVKESIDDTIRTVGNIARYGMMETDIVILKEMLNDKSYLEKFSTCISPCANAKNGA